MIPQIHLRRGKEESLLRRHPWIFSGAIESVRYDGNEIPEGALVDVYTRSGDFIARGHYQIGSIAVRVLTFEQEPIDAAWWQRMISTALDVRRTLGLTDAPDTTCYRLVHGEGDSLPGLVVDIYDTTAVIQCHSVGMYHARLTIADAIRTVYGDRITAIYDKSSQTVPFKAGLNPVDGYLYGKTGGMPRTVLENGEKFLVNWEEGQKTGFFIDQRFNRELVRRYARGRTVLNTFCYTGGFSVYALAGGAREVCSIDSSERAVALADANVRLNFGEEAPHTSLAVDAVEYLKDIGDRYDMIILDPPAFAKHHKVLGNAMQGYKRLNARALAQIKSGGLLFTFSCSQAVSKELFRTTVFSAAAIAGRKVRILHQLTPARRPSDQHLSSRRRIPQGIGTLRRINPLSNRIQIVDMERETIVREFLDRHKIRYDIYHHPASPTIEEAKAHWREDGSKHCKNLFFRNHKGDRHYLVCFDCDRSLAIHDLEHRLRQGKLTFASPQRMERYLGLEPGSVSPFGLINDAEHHVHLFLDRHLQTCDSLSFHPNDCRATVVISRPEFERYLSLVGNTYEYLDLYD